MTKKILSFILFVMMLFSSVFAETLYEDVTVKDVTRGVTHTYIERLEDGVWHKINVITADLSDKNVDMEILTDKRGISYKSRLSSIVKENGAVAAINADFFDNTTPSGRTTPLGLTVKDGNIISSASHDPGLASFIETDNGIITDYLQTTIHLHADNGNKAQILHINKYHSTQSIVLFTRDFGENTPENTDESIEMVVEDDKVLEIVSRPEGSPIPENGYVLKVDPKINNFFMENFEVGDNAEITVEISPDFGEIENAIGGGTVLVKKGKVANFTHNISGNNPRTAAGVSKDSKTLYLVTVEGRETNAPGISQTTLAEIMISLGAYNAINFDGGGSTEMVIRDDIVNTPSEGSERSISTALGIKSVGKNPYFSSMTLSASQENVCVGDYVEIWATPLDNYKNPITIGDDIKFKADDGGKFVKNKYYPKRPGKRTITATFEGVSAKIEVNVLGSISSLSFYPSTFSGESGYLSLVAADADGFKSQISPENVGWKIEIGNGSVSNGQIKADGKVTVSATFDDKIIKTTINGTPEPYQVFDKFRQSIKTPDFVILPGNLPEDAFLNMVINARLSEKAKTFKNAFSMGNFGDAVNLDNITEKSIGNTKIITLKNDVSVKASVDLWKNFLDLENDNFSNICIYLKGGNNFSDDATKRMFDKTLNKLYNQGKNVFVLSQGSETSNDIVNGIRYITLKNASLSLNDFKDSFDNSVYLNFKIKGDNLLYDTAKIWK